MIDNDKQNFIFSFTDFDGVEAVVTKYSDEGFSWPVVLLNVVNVLEKQFGYEIAPNIQIKGVSLEELKDNPYAFISPLRRLHEIDEELGLFPEAKAGLTD